MIRSILTSDVARLLSSFNFLEKVDHYIAWKKKEIGICILYDVYKLLPSCQRQEYFRLDTQVTIHCLFCNMNAPYSHYKNVLIWLDNYV